MFYNSNIQGDIDCFANNNAKHCNVDCFDLCKNFRYDRLSRYIIYSIILSEHVMCVLYKCFKCLDSYF